MKNEKDKGLKQGDKVRTKRSGFRSGAGRTDKTGKRRASGEEKKANGGRVAGLGMLDAGDGTEAGDGGQAQAGKGREECKATAAALLPLNGNGDAVAMVKAGHGTR